MTAGASKAGRLWGGLARGRGEGTSGGRGNGQLFRTAHALMLNTVLSGALGFAFWILAARLYSTERVGVSSALIAVMVTVSTLSQVNIGSAFVRFLPESARPASFILRGYGIAGALSLVVATLVALIAPRVAKDLSVLGSNRLVTVVWILAVVLWSVFALQDAALSALRFARWVPVENTAFGVLKIVALVALAAVGASQGMLVAWILPMAILVLPVNLIIFRKAVTAHQPAHDEGIVHRFGRRRLYSYLGMTGLAATLDQGAMAALPIVVVAILGATQNAYFYIAFTIVVSLEILGDNICTALTIEGSFASDRLHDLTIAVARRLALIMLPAALTLIVAAPIVLLFFGRAYADHATTVLRLLAFGSLFRAATWVYVAVCRVQGRGHVVLAISAAMSLGTLVGVIVFARLWGLNGVGLAGLVVDVIVAAAIVPLLVRFIRRPVAPDNSGETRRRAVASPTDSGRDVPDGGSYATGTAPLAYPAGLSGSLASPWPAMGADVDDVYTPAEGSSVLTSSVQSGGAQRAADTGFRYRIRMARRAVMPGASMRPAPLEVAALILAAATCAVLLIPAPVDVRFAVALAFVACGPGTAVISLLGARPPATFEIGLIVAIGVSIAVLVSEGFIWTGHFNPRPDLMISAVVVFIALGASMWWRLRSGAPAPSTVVPERHPAPGSDAADVESTGLASRDTEK